MDKETWLKGTGLTWSEDILNAKIADAFGDETKISKLAWNIKAGAGYDDSSDTAVCRTKLNEETHEEPIPEGLVDLGLPS